MIDHAEAAYVQWEQEHEKSRPEPGTIPRIINTRLHPIPIRRQPTQTTTRSAGRADESLSDTPPWGTPPGQAARNG